MNKKELVVRVIAESCDSFDTLLKSYEDLVDEIDQIYNQPDPELREKIKEICYPDWKSVNVCHCKDCEARATERLNIILSLLKQGNPKEPVKEPCPECNGKGILRKAFAPETFTCPTCNGTGKKE